MHLISCVIQADMRTQRPYIHPLTPRIVVRPLHRNSSALPDRDITSFRAVIHLLDSEILCHPEEPQ